MEADSSDYDVVNFSSNNFVNEEVDLPLGEQSIHRPTISELVEFYDNRNPNFARIMTRYVIRRDLQKALRDFTNAKFKKMEIIIRNNPSRKPWDDPELKESKYGLNMDVSHAEIIFWD